MKKPRSARALRYYQTYCTNCEYIVCIRWEPPLRGFQSPLHPYQRPLSHCPLCQSGQIQESAISLEKYQEIEQHWDLIAQGEAEEQQETEPGTPIIDLSDFL